MIPAEEDGRKELEHASCKHAPEPDKPDANSSAPEDNTAKPAEGFLCSKTVPITLKVFKSDAIQEKRSQCNCCVPEKEQGNDIEYAHLDVHLSVSTSDPSLLFVDSNIRELSYNRCHWGHLKGVNGVVSIKTDKSIRQYLLEDVFEESNPLMEYLYKMSVETVPIPPTDIDDDDDDCLPNAINGKRLATVKRHLCISLEPEIDYFLKENQEILLPAYIKFLETPKNDSNSDTSGKKAEIERVFELIFAKCSECRHQIQYALNSEDNPQVEGISFAFRTQMSTSGTVRVNVEWEHTDIMGKSHAGTYYQDLVKHKKGMELSFPITKDLIELRFKALSESIVLDFYGVDAGKKEKDDMVNKLAEFINSEFSDFILKKQSQLLEIRDEIKNYAALQAALRESEKEETALVVSDFQHFKINGEECEIPKPYCTDGFGNLLITKTKKDDEGDSETYTEYVCNGAAIVGRGTFPNGIPCDVMAVHVGNGKWIEHNIISSRLCTRLELKKVAAEVGLCLHEPDFDTFMRYHKKIEETCLPDIPKFMPAKYGGWNEDFTAFVLHNKTISLTGREYRLFRKRTDNDRDQHVGVRGTKEGWANGIAGILRCDVSRIKMYTSMAAMLLSPLYMDSLVFNQSDSAGEGKTLTARAANSLIGSNDLMFTAHATRNSPEDYFESMKDLFTILDDLALQDSDADFSSFLLFMVNGNMGKSRKNFGEQTIHRTICLTTFEDCLFSDDSRDGEYRRAINCSSSQTLKKQDIDDFVEHVIEGKNYGHLLEPYLHNVMRKIDSCELKTLYRNTLRSFNPPDKGVINTIWRNIALIATAGVIFEEVIDGLDVEIPTKTPKEVLELVRGIGDEYIASVPELKPMRTLDDIWGHFNGTNIMFLNYPLPQGGSEYSEPVVHTRKILGYFDNDEGELMILPSVLKEYVVSIEDDKKVGSKKFTTCMTWCKKMGFIKVEKSRYYDSRRSPHQSNNSNKNSGQLRYVVFDVPKIVKERRLSIPSPVVEAPFPSKVENFNHAFDKLKMYDTGSDSVSESIAFNPTSVPQSSISEIDSIQMQNMDTISKLLDEVGDSAK